MRRVLKQVINCTLSRGYDNKFHYLYKIVNDINNDFYIGIHSTSNINDGYLGSGVKLHRMYDKFGIDSFTKYILYCYDTRDDLRRAEELYVQEKLVNDSHCYNLSLGGQGFNVDYIPVRDINTNKFTLVHRDKIDSSYMRTTTKGMIHINNGRVNKLVVPKDLDKYLNDGWIKGQLQKSTLGKIVITKHGEPDRYIFLEELDEYLKGGWKRGGKTRNRGQTSFAKNNKWINNGINCIRVNDEEIQDYLNNGWKIGPLQKSTKNYTRITNGIIDKNISPDNEDMLQDYLNNGWKIGSCVSHKSNRWVSKDGKTISINESELQEYIDKGWTRGRSNIKKSTKS